MQTFWLTFEAATFWFGNSGSGWGAGTPTGLEKVHHGSTLL